MSTRFVPVILLSALLGIWLLSACAAPPSPTLRDRACENSVIDMDPAQAYRNVESLDYKIYWTLHMNFRAFEDDGNPVGCLRLYGRDDYRGTLAAIDGGGALVDTCETEGEVAYSEETLAYTSSGIGATEPVSTGVAAFSGTGHIACAINIRELAASTVVTDWERLELMPGDLAAIQSAFSEDFMVHEIQEYETFSIVAAGEVGVDEEQDAENPIVYYLPESIPELSVAMALPTVDDDIGTYDATLPDVVYERPTCPYVIGDPYYWWTNFDTTEVSSPPDEIALTFANRAINSGTLETCLNLIPEPPSRLAFWTGPAILYIGCHPDVAGEVEGGDCLSQLKGRLYGIVFDPADSKPQSD